ncbi:hypothetical protein [Streptomyces sp. NPDC057838]|uniref:hypothetical protein n=1 Tax=unclassified Streptomyces TaxID=2593676 RepID=UPI0036C6AF24
MTYGEFSNPREPAAVTGTDALPLPPGAHAPHRADGPRSARAWDVKVLREESE